MGGVCVCGQDEESLTVVSYLIWQEKEELQKQLNVFFLRITALPAALQQHLFCSDSSTDDQQPQDVQDIQFADALQGFMSA